MIVCHCSRCRRSHGHAAAYTAVAREGLELLEDRGLAWYVADGRERGFCRECGSSLFWLRAGSGTVSIAAGTLDQPTGLITAAHIFVDSKGDYYEIVDDLPRFGANAGEPPPRAGPRAEATSNPPPDAG